MAVKESELSLLWQELLEYIHLRPSDREDALKIMERIGKLISEVSDVNI